MKKILSLALAVMMVVSALPVAYATTTYTNPDENTEMGTQVTIVGQGGEYTVTVPASLEPGQTGTVTANGYWASNQILSVTAPSTVEVTDGTKTTNVNVSFAGIESAGSDLEEMNIPVNISIDDGGIKFGEWTGTIVYNVDLANVISFTIDGATYLAEENMPWGDWVNSKYNTNNFVLDGNFVKDSNDNYVKFNDVKMNTSLNVETKDYITG